MDFTKQVKGYISDLSLRVGKTNREIIELAVFRLYNDNNAFVRCPHCSDIWLKEELPEDDVIEMACSNGHDFTFIQYPDTEQSRHLIGKRIKELREGSGISQAQLAELTGLKRENISRIESGRYSTGQDILSKIAAALGKNLDIV